MEKDWPPLKESIQYKLGLTYAALYRFPWEEKFDFDSFYPPIPKELPWLRKLFESTRNKVEPKKGEENTENCPFCRRQIMDLNPFVCVQKDVPILQMGEQPVFDMDPIPCPFHILDHLYPFRGTPMAVPRPCLVTPEELERTKKFLAQLRASRGYHVDAVPSGKLIQTPFMIAPPGSENFKDTEELHLASVIDHISAKTGKPYKLVEVKKLLLALPCLILVTFTAAAPDAPPETFLTTLDLLPRNGTGSPVILECLLQPEYDAPLPDHPVYKMSPPAHPYSSHWSIITTTII